MHKECLTRLDHSLFDIKAWAEGDSLELKKWLGFGFNNHIFRVENGKVILYVDIEEEEEFIKVVKEKLTEEIFDNLCDNFFELIEESKSINSNQEIYDLTVKSWPALTIFDYISKYPEYATESIIRRLTRTRQTTENFSYELSEKVSPEPQPENYIFYQNQILQKPFDEFLKENSIKIIK